MSDLEETCGWIESAGLEVVARAGHRILNDYLPPELKDGDGYDAILALELALCERDPYVRIAPFLHVLGRRG